MALREAQRDPHPQHRSPSPRFPAPSQGPPDFLRLPCPVREAGGGSEGESGWQAAGHHRGGAEIRWPRVIINMGPPCSTPWQRFLCPVLCEHGCDGLRGKGFGTSVPLLSLYRRTLGTKLPDLLLY